MFRASVLASVVLLASVLSWASGASIDSSSLGRWQAQPGWTPSRLADDHRLTADGPWLKFCVLGEGKQMTWTLVPEAREMTGEPRYLLLEYRAENLDPKSADHLLGAQFGGSEWFRLLTHNQLQADGQPHVLAVDLLEYMSQSTMSKLMLRIGPATGAEGLLWAKLHWTNELPAGVTAVGATTRKPETLRLDLEQMTWKPSPEWTPRPPERHSHESTGGGVRFAMEGERRSMRWSSRLAAVDLGKLPYVSVHYRARGQFGPSGYVVYLSAQGKDGKKISVYGMQPGDVIADGRWHVHHTRLSVRERAEGSMAVGIDCLSAAAQIEIDYIEFSSQPPRSPVADVVDFQPRSGAWPEGKDGLRTLPPPEPVRPNSYMPVRMGLGAWFPGTEICVDGIPFQVAANFERVASTGTVDEDSVTLAIPAAGKGPQAQAATEFLVLLLACFPKSESLASSKSLTPLRVLDEPERAYFELRYDDASIDRLLPVQKATGKYGIAHGVEVYGLRPARGKRVVELSLHDRMQNASFAIAGVTMNTGQARVAEPESQHVWYAPVTPPRQASAETGLDLDGLTWRAIRSPILPDAAVSLANQPLFRLEMEGRTITSAEFTAESVAAGDGARQVRARFQEGEVSLEALLDVQREGAGMRLGLSLANRGKEPLTGVLHFPTVAGLQIGKLADTWYFCARRGGVIHRLPRRFRDEIGEAHPLQVDGFFNPRLGAGVCFLPRDLQGVFRWYCVGKDDDGANYGLEYLPQTIEPGQTWQCVPVVVQAVAGDWRQQLAVYRDWVRSWYKPLAARKEWFQRLWGFPTYGPTAARSAPVAERLDLVGLAQRRNARIPGATDYMHLFGWAISDEYGHWGAYNHFHQYGEQGKQRFQEAVRRCQAAGIPVGLYLDGYLVSRNSDQPDKERVSRWAVRKADGEMLYHENYKAHSMCPYVEDWRAHLVAAYRRVAEEIRPDGMYLDEFGKCMVSRTCYSREHGHPSPVGMCPGEWLLTRQIREALPERIATYCEFVPADVATQYLDGAYGHVALQNHREGYGAVAPHFVNLHRFAIPDFKTFELIYYTALRNGNWFLLKYPFFNGDGYYLTGAELDGYDEHSCAFLTRVFKIQHEHADAFRSTDVEPLVSTELAGLYANRFSGGAKTVWTLWNSNYRTARGRLLAVPHAEGCQYFDAWNDRPVAARVEGSHALLELELGPRSVGCVVQRRPQ